jgi:polysaccharide export outer membrane protein
MLKKKPIIMMTPQLRINPAWCGFVVAMLLGGCAAGPNSLPTSGPTADVIEKASADAAARIRVVDVTDAVARQVVACHASRLFSDSFGNAMPQANLIGAGDVVETSIWEAPPASLFSSMILTDSRTVPATTHATALPEQMVDIDGTIDVPFAGRIPAAGRTPQQVAAEITQRLKGKANQPQVLVRIIRNNTANVTVVGEVTNSTRMALTARGERVLDALAAAGGVRQPVNKMTLQLTRGNLVQALPLDVVIRDPRQNVMLRAGDVVTTMFQPLSFSVLGATGKNEEVNFESQGISLAQALARAGGLQDSRADAQGVFIFRLEAANMFAPGSAATADGRVPVIYRINLKDPSAFFVAQGFPVQDKDVLYISNAPAVELQKFLNIIVSAVYPVANVVSVTR